MIERAKTALVIFTIKQLRKLLEVLYSDERKHDKQTRGIIKHLQKTLFDYTGCWWI